MGISTINSSFPFTPKISNNNFHKNPSKPTNYANKRLPIVRSSYTDSSEQSTVAKPSKIQKTYDVEFRTLEGCKLGISRYPDFEYNARGGTGTGIGIENKDGNDVLSVDFDVKSLYIPSLNGGTTKFLGLPLPPFLKIDIEPEILQGSIDRNTGKVDLMFQSRFWFSIGSIYKAPPLLVKTTLTSEKSIGAIKQGFGERINEQGKCKLVGVSIVQPINDAFMNTFLGLPTECIAYLNANISVKTPSL